MFGKGFGHALCPENMNEAKLKTNELSRLVKGVLRQYNTGAMEQLLLALFSKI